MFQGADTFHVTNDASKRKSTSEPPYSQLAGYLLENCMLQSYLVPVLILTPDSESIAVMSSALTSSIPPDISLPSAITALVGEMHVSLLITSCFVGIPKEIPYSSQPLLTATQSSPETM
ncbi:hypothetical protein NC652_000060 [Populus alba x Populus x berolinensis]|nr:hypothetical protein NC652_000060 [Populus alba x Populus x berolinensis]